MVTLNPLTTSSTGHIAAHNAERSEIELLKTQLANLNSSLASLGSRVSTLESPTPGATTTQPMVAGAIPGWSAVYAEDFTRVAAIGQIESVYGTGIRGYGDGSLDTETKTDAANRGWYYPSRVLSTLQDVPDTKGVLDAWIHTETINGVATHLVAAPCPGPNNITYGRYSVRMRYPSLTNYKAAFLLWPTSEVWGEGELDFPEGTLSGSMAINHHAMGANPGNVPYPVDLGTAPNEWHVYTLEWYPGAVRYYLDGDLMLVATRDVPTTAHRWVLQMETTIGSPAPPPDAQNGHVQVDWVTIHQHITGYDHSTTTNYTFEAADNSPLPAPATSVRGTNTTSGNRARMVTPATQWSTSLFRLNTRFTDGKVTAFRVVPPPTGGTFYLGFRFNTATDTGYVLRLASTGVLQLGRWVNGNLTNIGTAVTLDMTSGNLWNIAVEPSAGGLKAKSWLNGTAEPSTYSIPQVFDFNELAGDVVAFTQTSVAGAAATGLVDDIRVFTP